MLENNTLTWTNPCFNTYVSSVNMFSSAMLYLHFYGTLVYCGLLTICGYVFFYNVTPFTMYAVIVQSLRIDTCCMSEAVMRLVAGIFRYENVVIHIMRMGFLSNVESYKLMPG